MSYQSIAMKNKHQHAHPKVGFKQYLSNSDEPMDTSFYDLTIEPEDNFFNESIMMKYQIRHKARNIRSQYS